MKPNYRLKEVREQHGWSQARVAEQIGTDAGNVSRWERGYSSPSPYYREKLSLLFGKEVHDLGLLGEDETVSPQPCTPDLAVAASAEQRIESLTPTPRILAGLSYSLFWGTGLLMLLFARKDRFVRFHSLQSLLLFGGVTLCNVAFIGIVSSLSGPALHLLSHPVQQEHVGSFDFIIVLAVLCVLILNIGAAVAWGVGIVMALRGRYYKLPLVGNSSEKITAVMFSH
ncbi:MAG TPA: helix-turn-helix domain-containing protein [Ktedonosporobacter sp.]|nr:helix-turn-helix domain-containing protein [Ktedonosporobacter sp.]